MTLAGGDRAINVDCLSEKIIGAPEKGTAFHEEGLTLQKAVEQMERQMVVHALEAANGNRSQAARDLGLTRQGLLNKINRYKILKK